MSVIIFMRTFSAFLVEHCYKKICKFRSVCVKWGPVKYEIFK